MDADAARQLIRRLEVHPPESRALIGFEPQTAPLDVEDAQDARFFAEAHQAAERAGLKVLAVREDRGRLSLWREAHVFWTR